MNERINVPEGSDCLQKLFDGILFSSLLHVVPKGSVLNRNTALLTEFTETAVIQLFRIKRHLLSDSGFTETSINIQPVCSFCLAKDGLHLHALL